MGTVAHNFDKAMGIVNTKSCREAFAYTGVSNDLPFIGILCHIGERSSL